MLSKYIQYAVEKHFSLIIDFLKFGNKFYEKIFGTPMGATMSLKLAEQVMNEFFNITYYIVRRNTVLNFDIKKYLYIIPHLFAN